MCAALGTVEKDEVLNEVYLHMALSIQQAAISMLHFSQESPAPRSVYAFKVYVLSYVSHDWPCFVS